MVARIGTIEVIVVVVARGVVRTVVIVIVVVRVTVELTASMAVKRGGGEVKKNEKNKLEAVILPDVDLVVRTSGTNRLSDFMTTRLENALIVFVDALWPDFGVFDFFSVIWRYRKASSILRDNKKKREMKKEDQIFYDN